MNAPARSDCHAAGQGPCIAACCPVYGAPAPTLCPLTHGACTWSGGIALPATPGAPDPALVVGQWRDPAEGIAAANRDERESWVPRLVLGETPLDLEGMPAEFHPDAIWTLPDDTTLEDAYALLSAAVRRIYRECLDLRTRWANNTDLAHAGAAVPRAVAYQYVAGQLHRAIEGATDIHPPKEHP